MGPELIALQRFGIKNRRPTKSSDCYALGMVIYETISGHLPFHEHTDLEVFVKVLDGERPRREAWFTDSLWGVLEHCWKPHPNERPSIEGVLRCLESEPPSPGPDEEVEEDVVDEGSEEDSDDSWDSGDYSSCMFSHYIPSAKSYGLYFYMDAEKSPGNTQARSGTLIG